MRRILGLVQSCVRGPVLHAVQSQALHSSPLAASAEAAITKVTSGHNQLAISRVATSTLPLTTGRQRVCVLGTGWGAARFLATIDPKLFNITVCFYTTF